MTPETNVATKTRRLTITAIFFAILLLQSFIPNIGYVQILPTLPAITTIPLTVAVYGALMGAKPGAGFGLLWGLTSLFMAYTQPGDIVSLMLFQNPVICLVPRIAAGFFPGLISQAFSHRQNHPSWVWLLSGLSASLSNTILVIVLTSLFFARNSATLASHLGHFSAGQPLILILMAALGLNGVSEAIFTAILTPIIVLPLKRLLRRIS